MSEALTAEAKVEETTETAPPWERDGETFDPERARKLVQNLKAASLQTALARVKALAAVGLPQDFAPFVPGATSEEIEKNLATLQKLISDAANEKTEAVLAAAPTSRGMAPNPAQHAAPARDAYEEAAAVIFG